MPGTESRLAGRKSLAQPFKAGYAFNLMPKSRLAGRKSLAQRDRAPKLRRFWQLGVVQRWVQYVAELSAVGTARAILRYCAVPTGLGLLFGTHPALKRWAKIFRPASGTGPFAIPSLVATQCLAGSSTDVKF